MRVYIFILAIKPRRSVSYAPSVLWRRMLPFLSDPIDASPLSGIGRWQRREDWESVEGYETHTCMQQGSLRTPTNLVSHVTVTISLQESLTQGEFSESASDWPTSPPGGAQSPLKILQQLRVLRARDCGCG